MLFFTIIFANVPRNIFHSFLKTSIKLYIFMPLTGLLYFALFGALHGFNHDPLEEKYGKIIHVAVIFRHGDRSPVVNYPLNPHINYPWENGIGQLLTEGKRRMFLLGKWFNKHYNSLLQSIRSHTAIRVDSSERDRTIMSAQCFMAGFYQPINSQILETWLNWHPVPVHVIPSNNNMINPYSNCPAVRYYGITFFARNKMQKKYDHFKDDFAYLEKNTGLKFGKNHLYDTICNVFFVWDTLTIEKTHNLTLPKWTKKVYPRTLEKIMDEFLYKEMKVLKVQRVMAGRIFQSLTAEMREKVENPNSTNTFHFYSGHDVLIAVIQKTLGVYDGTPPPFGASLVFEVRKKNDQYVVLVQYMTSKSEGLKVLHMPKCKTPCSLSAFLNFLQPKIPKNMKTECRVNGTKVRP